MNDPDLRRRRRVAETHHASKGNVREFDLFFTVSDAGVPVAPTGSGIGS